MANRILIQGNVRRDKRKEKVDKMAARDPAAKLSGRRRVTGRVKFKLVIAYDGTAYEGWQVQKIGTGVQQLVETALAKLFPGAPRLHSSSRTDTGRACAGHGGAFRGAAAGGSMTARKLALALNAHLPPDIRVVSAARARADFHARFDAGGKQYRYFVWNHPAMNPLLRHAAWHVPRRWTCGDARGRPLFVGQHDFQSFSANPATAGDHRAHPDAV